MSKFFGRKVSLQVGTKLFENLRIAFKVRRTLGKNPHPAEIEIYNLSQPSRAAFQEKGVELILAAGYNEAFGQIWSGQLRSVSHVKQGADWITKCEGGDGEKLMRTSRIAQSYKAGTQIATVIRDVAKATGLKPGNLEQQLATLRPRGGLTQYVYGTAVSGVASEALYRLLSAVGLNYSVQDGQLQVLADGASISNGQIFLLSSSSGLVGSPEIGEESVQTAPGAAKTAGKKHVLKVKSLLNHQLTPGSQVQIQSANLNGAYRIEKLEHRGDTHGGDASWITEMECRL